MVYRPPDDATLEELRAQHARVQLYLVDIRTTDQWRGPGDTEHTRLLREHFLYLYRLQAAGTLLGAGPLLPEVPGDQSVGMLIVAAPSIEAARRLAEDEPFHLAGWRHNTVRGWVMNEGALAGFAKALARLARD